VHYQVEGNLALGICKYTWRDGLLWRSLIEMMHSPKNADGEVDLATSRLAIASRMGRLDVVQKLLDFGAKVETKSAGGGTGSLQYAVQGGHLHVARFLLDEKHAIINARNHIGCTPLMMASDDDDAEMIELLCDRHADLDELDNYERSALWLACRNAKVDAVRVLLARGAKTDADMPLFAPLLAVCHEKLSIDWARRFQVIRLLAEHNANLDIGDEDGRTPLMRASEEGKVEMIEFLCDKHVNIDKLSKHNWSSLYFACYYAQDKAVRILLARGANANLGEACILVACLNVSEDEHKKTGDPATFWARRCAIVIELVRANANLHATNPLGWPPLFLARLSGQPAIVAVLEEALGV